MAVEIGEVAPDFMLRDDGNNEVRLSDLRGRNVVLVFYPLDFSPVCTRELKDLSATRERYAAAGAEILGISVDSRYVHGAFRRDEQLEVRLLADFHPKGGVARAYGAYLEPAGFANRATFVLDRHGVVRHRVLGSPGDARDPDEYLRALADCPI